MRNGDRGIACSRGNISDWYRTFEAAIFKRTDKTHVNGNQPPGLSCRPSVCSNMAMGMPTFLERPATTTFFPIVGIPAGRGTKCSVSDCLHTAAFQPQDKERSFPPLPVRVIISQTPQGVAGSMVDWSRHMRPTFTTWKPSTSLVGDTALQMARSSM